MLYLSVSRGAGNRVFKYNVCLTPTSTPFLEDHQYQLQELFNFGKIQGGELNVKEAGLWTSDTGEFKPPYLYLQKVLSIMIQNSIRLESDPSNPVIGSSTALAGTDLEYICQRNHKIPRNL